MSKKEELAIMPTEALAEQLQQVVKSVTGTEGLNGFKKAFIMASGIKQLKELLTAEYMAPIMQLQSSKLGFRTDKDLKEDKTPGPGYSMEIVKNCVIEAVLNGLQVTGNQFNIIAGNMYPTKEGTGYILNNFKGLKYQIVCSLPRLSNDGKSAAIDASIKWTLSGESNEEIIPIPIKVNTYMGMDAIVGKATRKARAWLISRITGSELTDGDVDDQTKTAVDVTKQKQKSNEEYEVERWNALIKEAGTPEELSFYTEQIPESLRSAYNKRMDELSKPKKS